MASSENARITTVRMRITALFAALMLALCAGMLAGCADNNAASSSSADAAATASADTQVKASVSIDTTSIQGEVRTIEVTVDAGGTVLDALEATGLELDVQDSQYGKFVNAIDGVATGDNGDMSGWLVAVNGQDLAVSADAQEVADGDAITWTYVTTFE